MKNIRDSDVTNRSAISQGEESCHEAQDHSMPSKPLISIVTSTYNAEKHLPNLISSLREQSYKEFEWIVVDGGSGDGTLDILRKNEDLITYFVSEPDKGIYDAWNKGLRHVRGEWILFLGADDFLWTYDVLHQAAAVLNSAYPAYRVVYGKVMLVSEFGGNLYESGEAWEKIQHKFRSVMCLPHTALFHHQDLFKIHGVFDTSLSICGDYELLLRELKQREAAFVDLVIAGMSQGGISSSPNTSGKLLFEMRDATRKNGRIFPGYPWVFAAVRHMLRRLLWRLVGESHARTLLDYGRRLLGKPDHWTRT